MGLATAIRAQKGRLRRAVVVALMVGVSTTFAQPSTSADGCRRRHTGRDQHHCRHFHKVLKFQNKSGQAVNDLHFDLGPGGGTISIDADQDGTADEAELLDADQNGTTWDASGVNENDGDVNDQDDRFESFDVAKVLFIDSGLGKGGTWYWTLDGQIVGPVNEGCQLSDGCRR